MANAIARCVIRLHAVAKLCLPVPGETVAHSQRMVALLADGLRYGAEGQRP
jgi:hypothetical protein